jgi:membrane protein YqaA with SNARE-associated domain
MFIGIFYQHLIRKRYKWHQQISIIELKIFMNKRGWVILVTVTGTSLLSGFLLWRLMIQGASLGKLGLVGVFLASMLSHLTVVARDMFIPLFLPLSPVYHPLVLGFSAGIGGAIGEVTTYFLGWGVAESMGSNKSIADDKIARWISRYGLLAVLLVALTPLPDTPIVILAGSRKLPFKKLLLIEVVGKSILYSLGAVVGGFVFIGLESTIGSVATSILMVVASIIFTFVVTWKPSRDWIFNFIEKFIALT